ncbi:hypothetical protein B0H15DRAFT_818124 [Mycena belliarum]|uniref:Uncharacterized protein n=1 Tax=Mycena belliarum TaxID=1033014 RepID=A0AAD6XSC0_9AGAR|nr:hypothetical protein B0H15DRAFT_818124 [Mycena belliae]
MGSVLPCPLIFADTFAQVTLVDADDPVRLRPNATCRARAPFHCALLRCLRLVQHGTGEQSPPPTHSEASLRLAAQLYRCAAPVRTHAPVCKHAQCPRCLRSPSAAAPPSNTAPLLQPPHDSGPAAPAAYAIRPQRPTPPTTNPLPHTQRRLRIRGSLCSRGSGQRRGNPCTSPPPLPKAPRVARKSIAVAYPATLRAQLPCPLPLRGANARGHVLASPQSAQVHGGVRAARPRPQLLLRAPDPHVPPAAPRRPFPSRMELAGRRRRIARKAWELAPTRTNSWASLGAGVGRVKGVGRPLRAGHRFARAQVDAPALQRAPRRQANGAHSPSAPRSSRLPAVKPAPSLVTL